VFDILSGPRRRLCDGGHARSLRHRALPQLNCDHNSKFIRTGPSVGFSLGRQLLLARRLVEAGVSFVEVVNDG